MMVRKADDVPTMSWQYRIFKQDSKLNTQGREIYFIGEYYYDKASNKPLLHTDEDYNPLVVSSIYDMGLVFDLIKKAFDQPIIELDNEGMFKEQLHED